MLLETTEQKRRWAAIHDILTDLCNDQSKLDAVTDLIFRLVWGGGPDGK